VHIAFTILENCFYKKSHKAFYFTFRLFLCWKRWDRINLATSAISQQVTQIYKERSNNHS